MLPLSLPSHTAFCTSPWCPRVISTHTLKTLGLCPQLMGTKGFPHKAFLKHALDKSVFRARTNPKNVCTITT